MKTLLKIILLLFTLLVVAVAIFFFTFDLNMYKGMITEKLSNAIGRDVSIDSMEMKLSLVPTVKARGVKIANPEGFVAEKPFLIADSIEVTLLVAPLFSKKIEIRDFTLGTVGVFLMDNGNSQNNWTFNLSDKNKDEDISNTSKSQKNIIRTKVDHGNKWLAQMRVDNIVVKNIGIVYAQKEKQRSILISDFSLKQLKAFSLVAVYNGISVKFSGSSNSILDLLQKKPNYALNLEAMALGTTAKISASIGNLKEWKDILLNFDLTGRNLKETLNQLKIENSLIPNKSFSFNSIFQGDRYNMKLTSSKFAFGSDELSMAMVGTFSLTPFVSDLQGNIALVNKNLAAFWGIKPMTIRFDANVTPKVITIREVDAHANFSQLKISGKALFGEAKPTFDLTLKSDTLDIQDVISNTDVQNTQPKVPKTSDVVSSVIPDAKINLSVLNLFNAKVAFDMPHIRVSNSLAAHLGINGSLILNNGQLNLKPLSLSLLDTQTTGNLMINAVEEPYKIATSFKAESLNLEKISSVSEYVKNASLDVDFDLTSEGTTLKEIFSHLNGRVIIEVPEGTIVNKWFNTLPDVIGVVRSHKNKLTFSTTDQESEILCGALNIHIKDGKITGDNNLAIETSAINFLVGGDVDLNAETMSLKMVPSLNEEQDIVNDILSVAQYVKINGTFSSPIATLDTEQAVNNAIHLGLSKLAKKSGLNVPDSDEKTEDYQLCTSVLGRQSKGEMVALQKEAEKKKKLSAIEPVENLEPTPDLSPKEQFKNQLLQSISDALQ